MTTIGPSQGPPAIGDITQNGNLVLDAYEESTAWDFGFFRLGGTTAQQLLLTPNEEVVLAGSQSFQLNVDIKIPSGVTLIPFNINANLGQTITLGEPNNNH